MHLHGNQMFAYLLPFLLLLLSADCVKSVETNYAKVVEKSQVQNKLNLVRPEVLLKGYRILDSADVVNRTCARDLLLYQRAINKGESWALSMLDSSSRIPSGLLKGHLIDMGMYDECMEAVGESTGVVIHGRHCMYSIKTTPGYAPIDPTLSICLPASCTADDVFQLLEGTIDRINRSQDFGTLRAIGSSCVPAQVSLIPKLDLKLWIFTIFLGVYSVVLALGTICDLVNRQHINFRKRWVGTSQSLARLSIIKNAEAIFNMKQREGEIPVLHGLRFLSTIWVVLIHEYLLRAFSVNINSLDLEMWYFSMKSLIFIVGLYSVDTFFVLSGFLMTYTFFKKIETHGFNIFSYYFHRFIRLTFPVLTFVLMAIATVPILGSGARYEFITNIFSSEIESKWWSVLLYIYNFVETDNFALFHVWSLSVDMQLFWISPLILLPLYRRPKVGLIILASLFACSTIAVALITWWNKYSALYYRPFTSLPEVLASVRDVYMMTYTRAIPWLLGILLGYEITYKNIKPNRAVIYTGWILTSLALAFSILGIRSITRIDYKYNPLWEIIYASFARSAWAFAICWIIYAGIHNSAGVISKFLSLKVFWPLSRLSYCIYLTSNTFPMLKVSTIRAPTYFDDYSIIQSFFSTTVQAIVMAFFYSITIEMPMIVLGGMISSRNNKPSNENLKTK